MSVYFDYFYYYYGDHGSLWAQEDYIIYISVTPQKTRCTIVSPLLWVSYNIVYLLLGATVRKRTL